MQGETSEPRLAHGNVRKRETIEAKQRTKPEVEEADEQSTLVHVGSRPTGSIDSKPFRRDKAELSHHNHNHNPHTLVHDATELRRSAYEQMIRSLPCILPCASAGDRGSV